LFFCHFFYNGSQYFAGAAPGSPEIDYNRDLVTPVDYIFLKIHNIYITG
jgi:hypothetical protein